MLSSFFDDAPNREKNDIESLESSFKRYGKCMTDLQQHREQTV
jgi:hypothetical protein